MRRAGRRHGGGVNRERLRLRVDHRGRRHLGRRHHGRGGGDLRGPGAELNCEVGRVRAGLVVLIEHRGRHRERDLGARIEAHDRRLLASGLRLHRRGRAAAARHMTNLRVAVFFFGLGWRRRAHVVERGGGLACLFEGVGGRLLRGRRHERGHLFVGARGLERTKRGRCGVFLEAIDARLGSCGRRHGTARALQRSVARVPVRSVVTRITTRSLVEWEHRASGTQTAHHLRLRQTSIAGHRWSRSTGVAHECQLSGRTAHTFRWEAIAPVGRFHPAVRTWNIWAARASIRGGRRARAVLPPSSPRAPKR